MRPLTFLEKLGFAWVAPRMSADFQRLQYQNQAEIRAIQNHRFMKLFRHACETVPFYQRKYAEAGVSLGKIRSIDDIKELPVIEKAELIAGFPDEVISQKHTGNTNPFMFVTGGTSGQTIKVVHSMNSIYATLVSYHRAYSNMMRGDYSKRSVTAYVYTSPYPFSSFFGAYSQRFISTLDSTEEIRNKLVSARPHLLTSYPSTLERLTREICPADLRRISSRLKAISLNSEMSSQSQRDDWSEKWSVPVLDEFCSEEVSTIMFHQCPHKSYHIHEDLCVLESVDLEGRPVAAGEQGNLVVTALFNYAMPLIRYNQQDQIILEDRQKSCECGICFPLVRSFEGRSNDAFILPSGKVLSSGYLLDVGYSALVRFAENITYWSLIQERTDRIVFECSLAPKVDTGFLAVLTEDLNQLFSREVTVGVRVVEAAQGAVRGKRRQIVSRVGTMGHRTERTFESPLELSGIYPQGDAHGIA